MAGPPEGKGWVGSPPHGRRPAAAPPDRAVTAVPLAARSLPRQGRLNDKATDANSALCPYLSSATSAASVFSSSSFFRSPSFSNLPYKSKISNSNTWVILF